MLRPVHGGCWWALALAVVAPVLWAGPAAAETTIQVDAGYAGSFVPGQEVPVRIRISADRLVRGTLEVGIGNAENGIPVAMAVEVPGGSQKEFLLTAGSGLNQSPDVVARLRQDDRLVASGQTTITAAGDTELVGLLPGAVRGRAVPGATPLAVDVGTARFTPLGEVELEHAPASLGPLSTLAADVDELNRLSPAARAGVLQWIDRGGRLLVDSARGQAVPGLPDAWQPGGRGRAAAGRGEVVATDGAIAAGRWTNLVEPSGWGTSSSRFGGQSPLATTLAVGAGLRTPRISWLVGFLAVYVVAVGPLLFLAVRRAGRPELAWIAVPLVAVLFSTGSYVVGRNLRKATQLVHASVLSSTPAGPVASSYVGVFSRSGETVRVGLPAGWSSGSFVDMGQAAATPSLVTRTAEGTDWRLPLEAGQFGMVQGTGPAAGQDTGGLEITAVTGAGGQVEGSVRNTTPFTIEDAAVLLGANATFMGSIGPGEQRPFIMTEFDARQMGGPSAEALLWGGMRGQDPDAPSDSALWDVAMRLGGVNFMAPGVVVAAGWTRDYVPEIRVGSRTVKPEGRTVVLGRQQVTPAAVDRDTLSARRDIVRDPFANRFAGGPRGGSVVRFVLPDGADTSNLVLRSPFGAAEVWQSSGWTPATCVTAACAPFLGPGGSGPRECPPGAPCAAPAPMEAPRFGGPELTVPPAAVRDGVIYVRMPGPASMGGPIPLTLGRST
jgi:hypothetical protein